MRLAPIVTALACSQQCALSPCSHIPRRHHAHLTAVASPPPPPPVPTVPRVITAANGSTKWLVVLAMTSAVVTRRDFASPFIVVGTITAAFTTQALKKAFNQQRPAGAPFTDPGMPSSHALVATFAATAWAIELHTRATSIALALAAATVSVLRVAVGYHTWAQIGVGTAFGVAGAPAWMALGAVLTQRLQPRTAMVAIYACYVSGSVVFVLKKMSSWKWWK